MIEISSIEKYVSTIMKLKHEKDALELMSHQWFFRGQKNSNWSVMPSIFREEKAKNEYAVVQTAIRQNPFEFKSLTEFEVLTKLQHYGLGTRLLDVTLNPLVALYFATEPSTTYELGKDKRYKQVENDGVIFYKYTTWHSLNELGVRIATSIPFIDIGDTNINTLDALLQHLKQNGIIDNSECDMLKKDDYKLFVEYIQKSYYIVSANSNDRLTRQSGAFILPTAIKINKNGLLISDCRIERSYLNMETEFETEKLIIPSKYKSKIREELDFFNINEATLFPELEHQMVYIQGKNKNCIGSVPEFQNYVSSDVKMEDAENDFNNATPNITKILDEVLKNINVEIRNEIENIIIEQTSFVDWKMKQQIRSEIRLQVSKVLQESYSASISRQYANKIVELLLNPTHEYIVD